MRILIDADGCPVVRVCAESAAAHGLGCVIFCDTAHEFDIPGTETVVCSTGADSVDFCLVNFALSDDIVITQDYGLAAMALSRSCLALRQDGLEYTSFNIDSLLLSRHTARKIRSAGGKLKGSPKRTRKEDENFKNALETLISGRHI